MINTSPSYYCYFIVNNLVHINKEVIYDQKKTWFYFNRINSSISNTGNISAYSNAIRIERTVAADIARIVETERVIRAARIRRQ